eukprot:822488-Pelagomonas_calceolata.AAC.2
MLSAGTRWPAIALNSSSIDQPEDTYMKSAAYVQLQSAKPVVTPNSSSIYQTERSVKGGPTVIPDKRLKRWQHLQESSAIPLHCGGYAYSLNAGSASSPCAGYTTSLHASY